MKIDKKNIFHWIYLVTSFLAIIFTIPLRIFGKSPTIILYGHKLNGNLLAFYDYLTNNNTGYECYFLTMDPVYYRLLKHNNIKALLMGSISHMFIVSKAIVVITDHGMHNLFLYRLLTSIKFIDVWHGIPFKGFNSQTFKHLHGHDEIWVSSETMKDIYVTKFGFREAKIKITGYGRVDRLVLADFDRLALLDKYGLPDQKTILIAPTWKQDDNNRSILPFGISIETFFDALDGISKKNNATIIFRTHLNSGDAIISESYKHIKIMPYANYPIAEDFLFIADVLVTDWSSIAFDYLVLKRPTVFLDVPAPFSNGFTLGPEHRFGEIVDSMDKLISSLDIYINRPFLFLDKYKEKIEFTTKIAYSDTLDGKSRERYVSNLKELLA